MEYVTLGLLTLTVYISGLCQTTGDAWRNRAEHFGCVESWNGTYHCLSMLNGTYKETCMDASLIKSEEAGCPMVGIVSGKSYLVRPFRECKNNSKDCPRVGHRYYYTDEMYKFPGCINDGTRETTELSERHSTTTEREVITCNTISKIVHESSSAISIQILILCIVTGIVIILCIVHRKQIWNAVYRKGLFHRKRDYPREVPKRDTETESGIDLRSKTENFEEFL